METDRIEDELVFIDDYDILGSNFYWYNYEAKGIRKEEILSVGLVDEKVLVHKDIIGALIRVDKKLRQKGFRLYIKEGYRSKALYELIYKKRVLKFGKEETDRLLNMNDMPHSRGKSVDVALYDLEAKSEIYMREKTDGTDALFYGYYKNKYDEKSVKYQELQDLVKEVMESEGFKFGTRNEYFHFDYKE